jgi:hypothetical protein
MLKESRLELLDGEEGEFIDEFLSKPLEKSDRSTFFPSVPTADLEDTLSLEFDLFASFFDSLSESLSNLEDAAVSEDTLGLSLEPELPGIIPNLSLMSDDLPDFCCDLSNFSDDLSDDLSDLTESFEDAALLSAEDRLSEDTPLSLSEETEDFDLSESLPSFAFTFVRELTLELTSTDDLEFESKRSRSLPARSLSPSRCQRPSLKSTLA